MEWNMQSPHESGMDWNICKLYTLVQADWKKPCPQLLHSIVCYRSCIIILKQLCTLTWGPCQCLCTLLIADCPKYHGTAWNMTTKASLAWPRRSAH